MLFMPVTGNINTTAYPDIIMRAHIAQKLLERGKSVDRTRDIAGDPHRGDASRAARRVAPMCLAGGKRAVARRA